jgi:hypothetical protein
MHLTQNETNRLRALQRTEVKVHLRAPGWAFAPVGVLLLYAVGLAVGLWALSRIAPIESRAIGVFNLPAILATALCVLWVGPPLARGESSRPLVLIFAMAAIWAGVAALFPIFSALWNILEGRYFVASFNDVVNVVLRAVDRALAAAIVGALGGLAGAGGAILLCTEKIMRRARD